MVLRCMPAPTHVLRYAAGREFDVYSLSLKDFARDNVLESDLVGSETTLDVEESAEGTTCAFARHDAVCAIIPAHCPLLA